MAEHARRNLFTYKFCCDIAVLPTFGTSVRASLRTLDMRALGVKMLRTEYYSVYTGKNGGTGKVVKRSMKFGHQDRSDVVRR